jgi:transcriptional regulator with XRE-family HTH domain
MSESSSARVTARIALGQMLRQYRKDAGLSGVEVAQRLGWSQAKVSRIESARVRAEISDIESLTRIYDIPKRDQASLLKLADEAAGPDSERRNSTGLGLSRRQQDFVSLEAAASSIRHYQTMLIPGPLQVPEYTQRVFKSFGVDDPSRAIETRAARRSAILRPNGPKFQVVLTETAIRWDPGPVGMLSQQQALVANMHSSRTL